jgi:hypothetical protein
VSRELIAHSPDLARLQAEGYEIRYREGFLLTSSVPYLDNELKLRYGTLACELTPEKGVAARPTAHPMWWQGAYPCQTDGTAILAIQNSTQGKMLLTGFAVDFLFSARPVGKDGAFTDYPDFYEKVKTYIGIISGPALQLYPDALLKTERVFAEEEDDSPFLYPDTNTSRAEINAISDKVKGQKIGIIGAGGTGSYILDLVAKSSVAEIHLFDADPFAQHNAFRSPGAASEAVIDAKDKKVAYFQGIYAKMRRGVIAHEVRLTAAQFPLLDGLTFVFIAIDKTGIKRELFDYLIANNIPFIDVGIGVTRKGDTLLATARVTAANGQRQEHLAEHVSMEPDKDGQDDYGTNIQIAELNALNAAVAVIHWKRQYGFYDNTEQSTHVQVAVEQLKIYTDDDAA